MLQHGMTAAFVRDHKSQMLSGTKITHLERQFSGELLTEHDHPGDPEEEDVVTGLHHAQREVPLELARLKSGTEDFLLNL